jgi:hypothetical protein
MIKVIISNVGEFTIHQEKLQELLNWLSSNGVRTQNYSESTSTKFNGQSLING